MILYRPVGIEELLLIHEAKLRAFPPRLPEQPIFYPVLGLDYATQIARDWNTKSGLLAGYVTEFEVDDDYGSSWPVHQAGARHHRELWIPAAAIEEFNRHLMGSIRVIGAYFGANFEGVIPRSFSLRGKDAREQFKALWGIYQYSMMDFHGEITANNHVVFAHFPYWESVLAADPANVTFEPKLLLHAIRQVWSSAFPEIPLGVQHARDGLGAEIS